MARAIGIPVECVIGSWLESSTDATKFAVRWAGRTASSTPSRTTLPRKAPPHAWLSISRGFSKDRCTDRASWKGNHHGRTNMNNQSLSDEQTEVSDFWEMLKKIINELSTKPAAKRVTQWSTELNDTNDFIAFTVNKDVLQMYIRGPSEKESDERTHRIRMYSRKMRMLMVDHKFERISDNDAEDAYRIGRSVKVQTCWNRGDKATWSKAVFWACGSYGIMKKIIFDL